MVCFSNELHKPNRIAMLDNHDLTVIAAIYLMVVVASTYVLIVAIPAFIYYLQVKKTKPRGFILHFLYQLQIVNAKGYPSASSSVFFE